MQFFSVHLNIILFAKSVKKREEKNVNTSQFFQIALLRSFPR